MAGKTPNGSPPRSKENSPFTPGNPVPVELFVGRAAEIEEIRHHARKTCSGKLENIFLSGERGIGKSSLARFVRELCLKDHKLLGIHVFLGGVTSLEELVRRVFEQLLKETHNQSWFSKIKNLFGNYIKEVGLFGVTVGFAPPEEQLKSIVRDFPAALKNIHEAIKDEYRGLLIILDDINGLADQAEFANWYKSFVDSVATQNGDVPVLFMLCGLPERRDSLTRLQPSLMRIFRVVDIDRLNDQEATEFFTDTFTRAGLQIDETTSSDLASACGGFPTLMHEVGDAVFWADEDWAIDENDFFEGLQNAVKEVGKKYLDPIVYRAIRSKRYRTILDKIAARAPIQEFRKQYVEKLLDERERKVFNNFLNKMRKIGVIEIDADQGRGAYRFVNPLYPLYIRMQSKSKS
ncbi:MAG: AAA family ATPase [Thermoguttaceae bacterium]